MPSLDYVQQCQNALWESQALIRAELRAYLRQRRIQLSASDHVDIDEIARYMAAQRIDLPGSASPEAIAIGLRHDSWVRHIRALQEGTGKRAGGRPRSVSEYSTVN